MAREEKKIEGKTSADSLLGPESEDTKKGRDALQHAAFFYTGSLCPADGYRAVQIV
jgi:hypothetical protein